MHEIIKSSFYVIFLITMIAMGSTMFFKSKENKFYKIFGLMTLVLGIGEAFYLIPRIYTLFSSGSETINQLLQTGKLISSITIVIVFTLLYKIWRLRYKITGLKWLDITMLILAMTSIILNLVLQESTSALVLIRIIPLVSIGIIITTLFYKESKKVHDLFFKYMWLAVSLSFVFFSLVELFEKSFGVVVILMLPKTIMYIWMISMGYNSYKKELQ